MSTQQDAPKSTPETVAEQKLLHKVGSALFELSKMIREDYPQRVDILVKHGEALTPVLQRLTVLGKINNPKK
jgi:hypothetical protein